MAIKYESIVPWSRSYSEYVFMFGLNESDLSKSILGCGDGPASFNSVMYKKGKKVISVDIIYQFSIIEIKQRIKATFDIVMNQTRNNQEKFVWSNIKNIYELGLIRLSAMQEFLNDYEKGKIDNNNFDLVLSSHFLFLYTNNLTLDFHIQSIAEMLRVAKEVRIFPLLDFNAIQSPYVEIIMNIYSKKGYSVKQLKVDYEFQKGGNKMLVIKQS